MAPSNVGRGKGQAPCMARAARRLVLVDSRAHRSCDAPVLAMTSPTASRSGPRAIRESTSVGRRARMLLRPPNGTPRDALIEGRGDRAMTTPARFASLQLLSCALAFAAQAEGFLDLYGGVAPARTGDVTVTEFAPFFAATATAQRNVSFGASSTFGARAGGWISPWFGLAIDVSSVRASGGDSTPEPTRFRRC